MSKRANVLAFAVIIVMVTAGAAHSLAGSNTVFSDDIVDSQVTTADVAPNAVTSSKINNGAVKRADIAGQVISADEIDGQWVESVTNPGSASTFEGIAECPTDYEVVSGGGTIDNPAASIVLDTSSPARLNGEFPLSGTTGRAWKMVWRVEGGSVDPAHMYIFAYCIHSGS